MPSQSSNADRHLAGVVLLDVTDSAFSLHPVFVLVQFDNEVRFFVDVTEFVLRWSTTLNRFVDEAISYWDLQELYPRICPPTVVRVLDEQRFVEQ